MKRLLLVDTFAIFFRSFFAFGGTPLTNKKGDETSVLFGFFNTLYKLLNERSFDYFACVLDSPGPTFRHELDANYKAHRPETPDSLKKQIAAAIHVLPFLGVPHPQMKGFEADDVIATLSKRAAREGMEVEIFSSDKDLTQLVDDRIRILKQDQKTGDFITMDAGGVREKWGVPPEGIRDLFALIGDTSDNVPGVKGVGPKTAVKLLEEFKSLDGIYEHLESVAAKGVREKLRENRDNAFLSKKLVTVAENIEGLPAPSELVFAPVMQAKALPFLQDWELTTVIKRFVIDRKEESFTLLDFEKTVSRKSKSPALGAKSEKSSPDKKTESAVGLPNLPPFNRKVLDSTSFHLINEKALAFKEMAFDIETTSLDPFAVDLVAAVFVFPDKTSYYARVKTHERDEAKLLLDTIKSTLEDSSVKKIGHNLKFEKAILRGMGVELRGIHFDTMIAAYFLDSNRSHYNLESLVEEHFHYAKQTYSQMAAKTPILDIDPKVLEDYTFSDGEFTWRLYEKENAELQGTERKLFEELDLKLIPVLAEMERLGVCVDRKLLAKLSSEMTEELGKLEIQIHEAAGETFNINSTKQLQEILFTKLGIKPIKKTKTGYSTDVDVLEKLARDHAIANFLLRFRVISKLLGTYVNALPEMIHPKTGRIHSDYNQSVAATGRLSSNNPNLQNIPIKGPDGRAIRRAFVAPMGKKLVSFDYSQVELRVLAELSQDPRLVEAYLAKRDIHRETASLLFGVSHDAVNEDQRRIAKTINFSVIYGISAFSLAEDLKVSTKEAQGFIDGYFKAYRGVREYIDQIVNEAREKKYVTTFYGRKRPIPEIASPQFFVRAHAERTAFNTVIQGTASDIIKFAMVSIWEKIAMGKIEGELVMQVHDELVFYLPTGTEEKTIPILSEEMRAVKPFEKILDVNWTVGDCWDK